MSRLDDVQAAHGSVPLDEVEHAMDTRYGSPRAIALLEQEHAAVPGLVAIARAAQELVRRDIPLEVVALCEASLLAALAEFEAGRDGQRDESRQVDASARSQDKLTSGRDG
jgi:hypothetical protein